MLVQGLKWGKIVWTEPWKDSATFNSIRIAFLKNMQKLAPQENALFHLNSSFKLLLFFLFLVVKS